jgi:hypothetical protein
MHDINSDLVNHKRLTIEMCSTKPLTCNIDNIRGGSVELNPNEIANADFTRISMFHPTIHFDT